MRDVARRVLLDVSVFGMDAIVGCVALAVMPRRSLFQALLMCESSHGRGRWMGNKHEGFRKCADDRLLTYSYTNSFRTLTDTRT